MSTHKCAICGKDIPCATDAELNASGFHTVRFGKPYNKALYFCQHPGREIMDCALQAIGWVP